MAARKHRPRGEPVPGRAAARAPTKGDAEFLAAFEGHALPPASRHHRDHLRAAYLLLERHSLDSALARMRRGIRAMNQGQGLLGRDGGRYHETLTQLWLRLLHGLRTAVGPESGFEAFLARHPCLLDRHLGRRYYTRDQLHSERARREFVEPDLAPFPGSAAPAPR